MFDSKLATSERSQEVNINFRHNVVALPFEALMWLFFNYNYDVASFYAWCLIALAAECYRLTSLHTLVDRNLDNLLFREDFLPLAICATVVEVYDLTSARAFITR